MIDYGALVHAIQDWRTGQRPGSGTYAVAATAARPEAVVEMDSGMMELSEDDSAVVAEDAAAAAASGAGEADDEVPAPAYETAEEEDLDMDVDET